MPLLLSAAFLVSLALSLVGTRVVRAWAFRRGFVDHPDGGRRIHTRPTPNVGGVAIVVSTFATFLAFAGLVVPDLWQRGEVLSMLGGGVLIFGLGVWDDVRHPSAMTKFIVQISIAALVFLGGVRILDVSLGDVWYAQLSAAVAFAVTVVWIVGTTNAFNLIDGSDGVAGGAALFASISMGLVFALHGDPLGALMATILVGACLGFLCFNFPPASIFMGDSGSLFLGFMLATLGVITTQQSSTLVAVAIPVVAFGIPLLDTTIAIVRRFLRGERIFAPDRGHIHHRLRDLGMSPRRVALLLYVACAGCASLSMVLAAPGRPTVLPVFVVAGAILLLSVQRLNVPELVELGGVMGRGLQQRTVISHNVRVRSAVHDLRRSDSFDGVAEVLRELFGDSEFSALEIWLLPEVALPQSDVRSVETREGGRWIRFEYERSLIAAQEFEIRFPLVHDGQQLGHLALFRRSSGPRLFTDLRLVSRLLVPETAARLLTFSSGARRSAEEGA